MFSRRQQALQRANVVGIGFDLRLPRRLVLARDSSRHHGCRLGVLLLRGREQLVDGLCRLWLRFIQQLGHGGAVAEAEIRLLTCSKQCILLSFLV